MANDNNIHELHPANELPTAPASQLKNSFKGVYQSVLQIGPVSITRNRKREAILLSAQLYDQMITELAARDPLEVLRQKYDACFATMQTDAAKIAYQDAYDASLDELGKTALTQAKQR